MYPHLYTEDFPFLSIHVIRYFILGAMKDLSLALFDHAFVYYNRSLVGETISTESITFCWSLRIIL